MQLKAAEMQTKPTHADPARLLERPPADLLARLKITAQGLTPASSEPGATSLKQAACAQAVTTALKRSPVSLQVTSR